MADPTKHRFTTMSRSHGYEVVVKNPGHKPSNFPAILGFKDQEDAAAFQEGIFATLQEAERDFDNGQGDTSDPEPGDTFQVMPTPNGEHMVHVEGVEVATYKNKKKANAVANALNSEVEKKKKFEDCYDPDPLGEGRGGAR